MCFTIHSNYTNALISKKDIYCYKELHKISVGCYSPVTEYKYWDALEKEKKTAEVTATFGYGTTPDWIRRTINEGIHTFATAFKSEYGGNIFIAKIPAGTKYYYNPSTKQYVSEKLIVYKSFWDGLIHKLFRLK